MLANLENLVIKTVNESGGYGMLIGPTSSAQRSNSEADPGPATLHRAAWRRCSTQPTFVDGADSEGRHVDLRPFICAAKKPWFQACPRPLPARQPGRQ